MRLMAVAVLLVACGGPSVVECVDAETQIRHAAQQRGLARTDAATVCASKNPAIQAELGDACAVWRECN